MGNICNSFHCFRSSTIETRPEYIVKLFERPARKKGIVNLKVATFPPSDENVCFLIGQRDQGYQGGQGGQKHKYLIKVPLLERQIKRELMAAVTFTLDECAEHFIVCGQPIQCKNRQFGFLMVRYPYSLAMLMNRAKEMEPHEMEICALETATGLFKAIQFAHQKGIIHCDMKPSNILVDEKSAQLADWGCCRRIDDPSLSYYLSQGYGSPPYQVVLQNQWSTTMVDTVGLAMTILELVGHLEINQADEVPHMELSKVVSSIDAVRLEPLRDILFELCKIKVLDQK